MADSFPEKPKPGDSFRVKWSCPCPMYRGDTVEFEKLHPASESHVYCMTYEGESTSFRKSDLKPLKS